MNCINCKADCGTSGIYYETNCAGYIPMTRADVIRQLNDDKLALLLYFATWESGNSKMSIDQWLEWLKEEVKDGST